MATPLVFLLPRFTSTDHTTILSTPTLFISVNYVMFTTSFTIKFIKFILNHVSSIRPAERRQPALEGVLGRRLSYPELIDLLNEGVLFRLAS